MMISPGDNLIFSKFGIFRLLGGVKGQKMASNENNYICHASYLRNLTSSDLNFWYTSVK